MKRVMGVDLNDIPRVRKLLRLSGPTLALPSQVVAVAQIWQQLPVEWVHPDNTNQHKAILFLHGGGYAVGSIQTHRGLAARLAQRAGTSALLIDYRLAPEHPFPAALQDAVSAYQTLLGEGYDPGHIALAGDSAGGGLAIACMVALRDMNIPLPACCVCFSPWVDLGFSGESATRFADEDPIVKVKEVTNWGTAYAGAFPVTYPLVSPLFADLSHLPPILIQASDCEVLTDDARRLATKLEEAGVEVHLQIWPQMIHVWQLFWRIVPEAEAALTAAGAFINTHTHLPLEFAKRSQQPKGPEPE